MAIFRIPTVHVPYSAVFSRRIIFMKLWDKTGSSSLQGKALRGRPSGEGPQGKVLGGKSSGEGPRGKALRGKSSGESPQGKALRDRTTFME